MVETDLKTKQDVSTDANRKSTLVTPERNHPWSKPVGPREKVRLHYLVQQCLSSCPRLIADLFVVALAHMVASLFGWPQSAMLELSVFSFGLIFAFWVSSQYPGIAVHPSVVLRRVFILTSTMAICMFALNFLIQEINSAMFLVQLLGIWLMVLILVPVCRTLLSYLFRRFDWFAQPVVVIGSDLLALSVHAELKESRQIGLRPLGVLVSANGQWDDDLIDPQDVIGTINDVAEIQKTHGAYWAFSATHTDARDPFEIECMEIAKSHFPNRLTLASQERHRASIWDETFCLGKLTMVRQTDRLTLPMQRMAKRVSDLVLSSLLIVMLSPILAILYLLVRLTSSGSAIFQSRRIGRGQKEFSMSKFRTMYQNGAEILEDYFEKHPEEEIKFERDLKLENDPRITWIGGFLRRSSLDELPQLFDVFRGKMSMVGPRPMLLNEQEFYGDVLKDYNRVLPGITGMWQVSGRNQTSYEDRLHYVEFYIQNWSIWLDLCVLFKTAWVVLKKEGAY